MTSTPNTADLVRSSLRLRSRSWDGYEYWVAEVTLGDFRFVYQEGRVPRDPRPGTELEVLHLPTQTRWLSGGCGCSEYDCGCPIPSEDASLEELLDLARAAWRAGKFLPVPLRTF